MIEHCTWDGHFRLHKVWMWSKCELLVTIDVLDVVEEDMTSMTPADSTDNNTKTPAATPMTTANQSNPINVHDHRLNWLTICQCNPIAVRGSSWQLLRQHDIDDDIRDHRFDSLKLLTTFEFEASWAQPMGLSIRHRPIIIGPITAGITYI